MTSPTRTITKPSLDARGGDFVSGPGGLASGVTSRAPRGHARPVAASSCRP
jgi:hypothetical protein